MIQTPVGARCAQCARMTRLRTFIITPGDYLKVILAGIGVAVVCGILWYFIRWFIPHIVFINLLVAAGIGYGIGQAMSYSVNRKRGLGLKIVAGICVLIAYVIGNQMVWPGQFVGGFNLFNIFSIAIGVYLAVTLL